MDSIKITVIDMEKLYFNAGCAMIVQKPEAEQKLFNLLKEYLPTVKLHSICCSHEPNLPAGSTIINNCAGCDRRFRTLYEGIQTISLWEILDTFPTLPLPNYNGIEMSIQDSCSFREKPQVHKAVRNILGRMNINIVEAKNHGTTSICCGDSLFSKISVEKVNEAQKKRAAQMPCDDVVVYCASCIKSMYIGGKNPHHMVDLIFGETTEPNVYETEQWHKQVKEYSSKH